jgi:hypothetical protein
MLLAVKAEEHIRIKHDTANVGFAIHIASGEIHIRAKSKHEPGADKVTLVVEANIEVVK